MEIVDYASIDALLCCGLLFEDQARDALVTFGMMLANVPAVLFGERIARKMPLKLVHGVAAAIFALLGIGTLLGAGASFGF